MILNKIVFFVGSPKQAHYFNKLGEYFTRKNCEILVITRDKECTLELVDYYFDRYEIIPFPNGFIARVANVFSTLKKIYQILKVYNPDIVLGSIYPGMSFISKILSVPNIAICDTDHAWMTINATYPFFKFVCHWQKLQRFLWHTSQKTQHLL